MHHLNQSLVLECKEALLKKKADLLNRIQVTQSEFQNRDRGKDETDLSMNNLAESQFVNSIRQIRFTLLEIETALMKIEKGNFGICEETYEEIEVNRLKAIPWTRLSIEGAEIRDSLKSRFNEPKLRLLPQN